MENITTLDLGSGLNTSRMPGHWVLARLGKRVLRPGGMELTRKMLAALKISNTDRVVEFAPGMGMTARLTLKQQPASYTAVERDPAAARVVSRYLKADGHQVVVGSASATRLPPASATVVYGEAMLTMQTNEMKHEIVREAFRLLKRGGRYGIHEMCLTSNNLSEVAKRHTEGGLTRVVHHGVRPLSLADWSTLLESEGFEVRSVEIAAMSLLEPGRLVRDEGLLGAMRFVKNVLSDGQARSRVLEMRSMFRRNRNHIGAVAITCRKP